MESEPDTKSGRLFRALRHLRDAGTPVLGNGFVRAGPGCAGRPRAGVRCLQGSGGIYQKCVYARRITRESQSERRYSNGDGPLLFHERPVRPHGVCDGRPVVSDKVCR